MSSKNIKSHRSPLILLISILIIIGFIFISITSLSEANSTIGDKFFFLKKQATWLSIGIIMFFVTSKIKLEFVKKNATNLYIFSLVILGIVLIPQFSNEALGARRWLNLGFFGIQPSEIFKLTAIIFFSYLFSKNEKRNIKHLIFYLSMPFILIISEPNLSTAILISAIIISIYYISGGEILSLFSLCLLMVVLSGLLILISPYRSARFNTLIDPNQNSTDSSYHSNQNILALSSGGLFGKGFGNSDQKYRFLPKISTDSILAVIGEETGFVGVLFILLLYTSLTSYFLKLSSIIPDSFESLIVAGTGCWIAFQSLINISAIAALIPLTGIPLPFISYGGSSLITLFCALGLVHNIEKNNSLLLYSNHERLTVKNNNHHRNPPYPRRRISQSTTK